MGIPRLLNHLIERYPCLAETSKANKLPQYDNLYIDMNFLIHNMVPNNECRTDDEQCDVEAEIFDRTLSAIETLFRLIRPVKLLFLAVDGVAPRAKWNKQRQRRFCAAFNQLYSFDTNCISPGTEFMQRLDVIVNEFIATKLSQDKCWQNCRILFSGSNTPGEGSHKIIEYMRHLKTFQDYSANRKHCIFSGDTDFLMMGIGVHEIYVTLLQNFKRRTDANAVTLTDDINHEFRVIHLEHLREYIEMEFSVCESLLSFKFNMDNLADDWVLLCFLFGNDFVPHLPNFHVNTNILAILCDVYKRVLPKLDGYINERGRLNIHRFNIFLNELKKFDLNIYKNHVITIRNKLVVRNELTANDQNGNGCVDKADEKEMQIIDANAFSEVKKSYYNEKNIHCTHKDIRSHAIDYVSSIQWILSYYYTGNYSWNWYYPCNYAPFVSDFPDLSEWKFEFISDEPALPLEHLLAIQPIKSAQLLPQPIRALMQNDLMNYFHEDIKYDLNEKIFDREAIALLPFIEEDVFGEAFDTVYDQLSEFECKRNERKPIVQYECLEYEDDTLVDRIELSNEQFTRNSMSCIPIKRTITFGSTIVNFSHLKYLSYSAYLEKSSCPNGSDRLFIEYIPFEEAAQELETIASKLLNKTVSIGWPRVHQARVVSLSSPTKKITWCDETQNSNVTSEPESADEFKKNVSHIQERAHAQGIRIGQVDVVAHVTPFQFEKFVPDAQTKEFVAESVFDGGYLMPVAVQTIVKDYTHSVSRSRICARGQIKLGSLVFLLGNRTYHGQRAYVMAKSGLDSTGRVTTYVHMEDEPDFSNAIEIHSKHTKNANGKMIYRESVAAAQSIGINAKFLARLTGNVLVFMTKRGDESQIASRKINIGLQLKPRNQANASNDFVKCDSNGWSYSRAAIDLVNEYLQKFSRLTDVLNSSDIFVSDFASNHLTEGKQYLNEINRWLAQHPKIIYARTQIAGRNLPDAVIKEIITSVDGMSSESNTKIVNLQVKWQNLYIPDMNNIFVIPDPMANYQLFDRVIIVRNGYAVSIGAKGTIIEINSTKHFQADVTEQNLTSMDILMDKPFKRATTSECDLKETRTFHVRTTTMLMNITHGKR